jgi:hypothetical protein
MQPSCRRHIAGSVEVVVRSRHPKLWGWELYRDGNDTTAVARSTELFAHAEDAWKAGHIVLADFRFELLPRVQEDEG